MFSTVVRTLGVCLANENPADAKPKAISVFLRETALPAFFQKVVRLCAIISKVSLAKPSKSDWVTLSFSILH